VHGVSGARLADRRPRERLAALGEHDAPDRWASADAPTESAVPAGRVGRLAQRWLPARWRGARVDPGRMGAAAFAAVAAVAAVVAAIGVWRDRPVPEPAPPLAAVSATPDIGPSVTPSSHGLVVSVVGKVVQPGLVRLPEGARVADVLDAAGGALPGTDLAGLNLARKVADGEQVAVGVPQPAEAAAGSAGGPAPAAGPPGKVNLNQATLDQLDALPGVGPVTAQRILDWRTQHGRFSRVEQLREVDGIGERRFSQLRELVVV